MIGLKNTCKHRSNTLIKMYQYIPELNLHIAVHLYDINDPILALSQRLVRITQAYVDINTDQEHLDNETLSLRI